jgi:oligosaccharide repeat unit polymerase
MKLNLKKISNPFTTFAISWSMCLFLYSLGWSDVFPAMSQKLFLFLAIFIITFFLTGFVFNKIEFSLPKIPEIVNNKKLLLVNGLLFSSNFVYSGVPLLKGTRIDDFGIPTIIVIATTFNSFLSVYFFYCFLIARQKILLLYILICFSFFMLAFSRGNIMMSMVTMFFLWINIQLPNLNFKKLFSIISGILLVMFVFGIAGNYRTINDISQQKDNFDNSYNSNVILSLGGATDDFKANYVPDEFFWTYLYLTSPLSNLQYNIDKHEPSLTLKSVFYIVIDEFLFDTVSKRIDNILDRKHIEPDLVVEQLTVSTTLAESYDYAGWAGMLVFMLMFLAFPFIYSVFVLNNPLALIGISTLCTVYFFSIFDNMFILTGLTFQILYPIILHQFNERYKKQLLS